MWKCHVFCKEANRQLPVVFSGGYWIISFTSEEASIIPSWNLGNAIGALKRTYEYESFIVTAA